jgi:hypothetical protein
VWTFTFQRRIRRSFRDLVRIAGRDRNHSKLCEPLMRARSWLSRISRSSCSSSSVTAA